MEIREIFGEIENFLCNEIDSARISSAVPVDRGIGVRQHDDPCATFLNFSAKQKPSYS